MSDYVLKANDTLPVVGATLTYAGGGVVDLTGATVTFIMRKKGGPLPPKVDKPAEVVDATAGTVRYVWVPADTNQPGEYDAEWEVVFPNNGGKQTFPTLTYHTVKILADLDEDA